MFRIERSVHFPGCFIVFDDKVFMHYNGHLSCNLDTDGALTAIFITREDAQKILDKYKPKPTLKDVKYGQKFCLKDGLSDCEYIKVKTTAQVKRTITPDERAIIVLNEGKLTWLAGFRNDEEVELFE